MFIYKTYEQLSNEEKPAISVSDLKLRFENNSLPYYEPKANQDIPIGEVIIMMRSKS